MFIFYLYTMRGGADYVSYKIDRRIKKTKAALKKAYIILMEQFTDQEITVSMIAQYAELNRSTFYTYYSNKEELLEEILCDVLEGLKSAIMLPSHVSETINVNKQAPTTVLIFEYIESKKRVFYALYHGHVEFKTRLEQLFYALFSEDIKMEMQSPIGEVNYDMFLRYQTNATLGLIYYWIENNFSYSTKFMMDQLTVFSNTQIINLRRL